MGKIYIYVVNSTVNIVRACVCVVIMETVYSISDQLCQLDIKQR